MVICATPNFGLSSWKISVQDMKEEYNVPKETMFLNKICRHALIHAMHRDLPFPLNTNFYLYFFALFASS